MASINIQRGRERGLPDFNTLREEFGLPAYTNWLDINSDYLVFDRLHDVYQLDDMDPWVGMLAEEPVPGSIFGETVKKFMEIQFLALRDGDRFYYEIDPVLANADKEWIKNTTLHEVIMLNTGVTIMQNNVFEAMPYEEICDHLDVDVLVDVRTPQGIPVPEVQVDFQHDNANFSTSGLINGALHLTQVPGCGAESLVVSKDGGLLDGVSTYDLVLMSKHILGLDLLDTPYQYIAADVNNSGSITTLDIINVRKAILGIVESFNNNTSWRLVPAYISFDEPSNALIGGWDSTVDFDGLLSMDYAGDFIAVKIGDVNESIDLSADGIVDERFAGKGMTLQLEEATLAKGSTYAVDFYGQSDRIISGYQFALNYNTAALKLVQVETNLTDLTAENFGVNETNGEIATSWNQMGATEVFKPGQEIFSLVFEVIQGGKVSDFITLNDRGLAPEAYDAGLNTGQVSLEFVAPQSIGTEFALYQNQPNPFESSTIIPFYLPQEDKVNLTVFDVSGKVLFTASNTLPKGHHQWTLTRDDLPESGILIYQVETSTDSKTRRMMLTR